MKSFVQTRRGLSTVVTTAIMLSAVAVLGTAVVGWSNSNLKVFETGLSTSSVDKTNKINENLLIENVAFCKTTACPTNGFNGVNITLTNVGYDSLAITNIQINGSSFSWNVSPSLNIKPQTSSLYQHVLPWHSKSLEKIIVTTARG